MNPTKASASPCASAHCQWWPPQREIVPFKALEAVKENESCHGPGNGLTEESAAIPQDLHNEEEKQALSRHRDIKAWDSKVYQDFMKVKVFVWTGQCQ